LGLQGTKLVVLGIFTIPVQHFLLQVQPQEALPPRQLQPPVLVLQPADLLPTASAANTQTLQDDAGDATQTDEPMWATYDVTQTDMQLDVADATQTEGRATEDSTQTILT
jgi:hypothetical protein